MPTNFLKINSITALHQIFELEKPTHPLISLIDTSKIQIKEEHVGVKTKMELFSIALKDGNCGLDYGRNHYDFNDGVLVFTAPNQILKPTKTQELGEVNGWMLYFHPDLIRHSVLGASINQYSFFSYEVHEALHLSEHEQRVLTDCVHMLKEEISERIDNHSQKVIISGLELLLNYCSRYYERQFNTRTAHNKDVLTRMEGLMNEYYSDGKLLEKGLPSTQYFATKVNLSSNYLSDLLRKETGRTTKEHINYFVVEKAKNLLLSSNDSVSEIAYSLGFNYPHYFSRMFKGRTGHSPQDYRTRYFSES